VKLEPIEVDFKRENSTKLKEPSGNLLLTGNGKFRPNAKKIILSKESHAETKVHHTVSYLPQNTKT
jgi:hypothetical protein